MHRGDFACLRVIFLRVIDEPLHGRDNVGACGNELRLGLVIRQNDHILLDTLLDYVLYDTSLTHLLETV